MLAHNLTTTKTLLDTTRQGILEPGKTHSVYHEGRPPPRPSKGTTHPMTWCPGQSLNSEVLHLTARKYRGEVTQRGGREGPTSQGTPTCHHLRSILTMVL